MKNDVRFIGWARYGLESIPEYLKNPTDKLWIIISMCAACCAELDRKHKEKETQILQGFCWEHGYLKGETTYEEYCKSGYFLEKYSKNP